MPAVVTVIGGGWSAGTVDNPPQGEGFVIGVNDAAIYARCDVALTMDRLWLEHRAPILKAKAQRTLARSAAVKNVEPGAWLEVFECDWTVSVPSRTPGVLNGTNSGLCALNFAWQLHPERIVMVGFDMRREPGTDRAYWYPPYPWRPNGATTSGKYKVWAQQFGPLAKACSQAGIELLNASPASAITGIRPCAR